MNEQKVSISQRPAFGMAFMVNCGPTGNMVRVDMPEVLGDADRKAHFNPVLGDPPIVFQRSVDGTWFYDQEVPSLAVRGTMQFGEDTLSMTLTVKNTGSELLRDVTTQICVQLAAAPLFRDPERRHIYIFVDGRPTEILGIEAIDGFRAICYLVKGQPADPRRLPGSSQEGAFAWVKCSNTVADDGLICVTSPDGEWSLGTMWEQTRYVFNNPSPVLACLHADPYLGDLLPGETVSRRGWVSIIHGSPDDLYRAMIGRLY